MIMKAWLYAMELHLWSEKNPPLAGFEPEITSTVVHCYWKIIAELWMKIMHNPA